MERMAHIANDPHQPAPEPLGAHESDAGRVGVVDIGSNSVRLVVFNSASRVPLPLFNEKVLCGLGRGLDESGELNKDGVALALETLSRFAALARAMKVRRLDFLATAAVRDARNGPAFVRDAEGRIGQSINVLSGAEEARLSAQGVLSGMPQATGAMGDLGGGSLEIAALADGQQSTWATLPLGPLRLINQEDGDRDKIAARIDAALDGVEWLPTLAGKVFYPVGGAWRALARVQMQQSGYPLHMIHGYTLSAKEADEMLRMVASVGRRSLSRFADVSKRRLETLPYAALLLQRLIQRAKPARLVFSAFGLREGWIYDGLDRDTRSQDPLISAATVWAADDARFPELGPLFRDWTRPLFPTKSLAEERLRHAVCLLSDVGWRYHPDYRAEQMMLRVLRAQELCVEHAERAFIALSLQARYGSDDSSGIGGAVTERLLPPRWARAAELLGRTLRLGYVMSGGSQDMIRNTRLELTERAVRLFLPRDAAVPPGQVMERRLEALAQAAGRSESSLVRPD